MTDFFTAMKPAIDAAAEGRLRCVNCRETLTVLDPFTDRVVKVRPFKSWVTPAGEAQAWCDPPCA